MKVPRVSRRQLDALERSLTGSRWYIDEQVWSFLTACLLAENPSPFVHWFCGEKERMPDQGGVWCEAEPLSTRGGSKAEGNTVVDIAFGHVTGRQSTGSSLSVSTTAGVGFGPLDDDSWVCFVEAKYLSDCSTKVTHDPQRNQLTRVIENLLCFQAAGHFPARLHFALLTPRVFREQAPKSRLYGYKMRDYQNHSEIIADIERCTLRRRVALGYKYPDVAERISALAPPRWVTFEDVFEAAGLGSRIDLLRPEDAQQLRDAIHSRLARQRASNVGTAVTM